MCSSSRCSAARTRSDVSPSRSAARIPADLRNSEVSFAAPCTPLAGGFDSGLQQIPNGTLPNQAGSLEYRQVIANRSIPLYFTDLALSNCITGATFCVNTNETQGSTTTCGAFRAAASQPHSP